jgi:hypothetical protein
MIVNRIFRIARVYNGNEKVIKKVVAFCRFDCHVIVGSTGGGYNA